jgi:hypothetical protein
MGDHLVVGLNTIMSLSKNIDIKLIKQLFEKGKTNSEISKLLDIKSSTVSYWKKKLNFDLERVTHDWDKIQKAHNNGASYSQLGEMFGVSKRALQMARNRGDFTVRKIKRVPKDLIRKRKREEWMRYHARKKYNTPIGEDISKIKEFYKNCPDGYEVDHIIPLSKGGSHCLSNLQYLTISENRKKSNKI